MRRRRPTLDAPEALDGILLRAGESRLAPVTSPIPLPIWKEIVGPRVAERARPHALERGVLLLRVPSSVWAQELSLLSAEILPRLVARGYEVRELRFSVGPLEGSAPPPPALRTTRTVPRPGPLPPTLKALSASVDDDELRQALEDAARANLAWQDHVATRAEDLTAGPRGARVPRGAETESAPPGRRSEGAPGAGPGKSGGGPGRRR